MKSHKVENKNLAAGRRASRSTLCSCFSSPPVGGVSEKMNMKMQYEIECGENDGEKYARIISDDEDILNDSGAMDAVGRAVRREFGRRADTVGRGCSYFRDGREAGWEWTVK
jgi:hypothetical protein